MATAILFGMAVAIVGFALFATLFTVIYHKWIYPKIRRPRYQASFCPKVSIILPCKGLPSNFENNVKSFLELDYKTYEVLYCVESDTDPAVPFIRSLVENDQRARMIVAGITSRCGQKNFNMIAAVEQAESPDVLAFADSDIKLHPNWLSEIVRPLSCPTITVTTGFRWLYSPNGKLGEIVNAYQSSILYIIFTFASFTRNMGLWGGSMAMRTADFKSLGVKECWARTVVDDMSLLKLIMKRGKKSVMVSPCITPTNDALATVGLSMRWFERQIMFLKAYQPLEWLVVIGVVCLMSFFVLWLPVALLIGTFSQTRTFLEIGGASSLVFMGGMLLHVLLYPLLGKHPAPFRFMLFQPVSMMATVWGTLRTIFTTTIHWNGFNYTMRFNGIVKKVSRS